MHAVRGSNVKNNWGGTEHALGNLLGILGWRFSFLKILGVLFCVYSGRQSHLYADLFKEQLAYSISLKCKSVGEGVQNKKEI